MLFDRGLHFWPSPSCPIHPTYAHFWRTPKRLVYPRKWVARYRIVCNKNGAQQKPSNTLIYQPYQQAHFSVIGDKEVWYVRLIHRPSHTNVISCDSFSHFSTTFFFSVEAVQSSDDMTGYSMHTTLAMHISRVALIGGDNAISSPGVH